MTQSHRPLRRLVSLRVNRCVLGQPLQIRRRCSSLGVEQRVAPLMKLGMAVRESHRAAVAMVDRRTVVAAAWLVNQKKTVV